MEGFQTSNNTERVVNSRIEKMADAERSVIAKFVARLEEVSAQLTENPVFNEFSSR